MAPAGSVTNRWRKLGITARALAPRHDGSTGTSRQPSDGEALVGDDPLDRPLGLLGVDRVGRQERQADGVGALGRQRELGDLGQEAMRDLDEDARAVAGVRLCAGGATVLQVAQRADAHLDELAAADAVDVGHERDATGVVLEPWVIQTRGRGEVRGE